jgi:hypothetical protein
MKIVPVDVKIFGPRTAICCSIAMFSLSVTGGCAPSCSDDNVSVTVSPDMKFAAYKFSRNCGATTGLNVQVSILEAGESPAGTGNTFIADGAGKRRISVPTDSVDLSWDRGILHIKYDKGLRLFKQEKEIQGKVIIYEAF